MRYLTIGLVVGVALVVGPAGVAKPAAEFTDLRGDSGDAPDVVSVSVSNDARGELSVFVLVLGGSPVSPGNDAQMTLVLDTDKNDATGFDDGFDYAFQYDARSNTHAVGRWDGTQFALVDAPSAEVMWSPLTVNFRINRSDLGGTAAFDFFVRSHFGGPASGVSDDAPDVGVWSYELSSAPAIAKLTSPTAIKPRAGAVLDVRGARVQLTDGRVVAPERLTCRLTAGGAAVKPLAGGCRWRIPARLKGKTVVLTLVARYGASELRVARRGVVR